MGHQLPSNIKSSFEVLPWISKYILLFHVHIITYSCLNADAGLVNLYKYVVPLLLILNIKLQEYHHGNIKKQQNQFQQAGMKNFDIALFLWKFYP